jgi:hypothetical protein
LVVAAAPAFAQFNELTPMDITAEVINVERVHGVLLDEWTFTVEVTNNESHTIDVALAAVFLPTVEIMSDCPPPPDYADYRELRPGRSVTLSLCVVGYYDMEPDSLAISGWLDQGVDPTSRHFVAFDRSVCSDVVEYGMTCSVQSITRLIRDIEPTPTQCEAPATTPAQTDIPRLDSTAYHKYSDNIILTFDTPVTLSDGWHERINIHAETESGTVEIDGLDTRARNLMPDVSYMVWLTLGYDDARQLNDVTSMTLHIEPGTVMYGDGDVLRTMLLPPVTVVP